MPHRQNNPLTAKQRRFTEEYLVDLNATQAALRAGYRQPAARSEAPQHPDRMTATNETAPMDNAHRYLLTCRHTDCTYKTFETLKLMQHTEQHDRPPTGRRTRTSTRTARLTPKAMHTDRVRATNAKRQRSN